MTAAAYSLPKSASVLIEGYASLFGVEDAAGDCVRAGAFASGLNGRTIPMLLQHHPRAKIGPWVRVVDDGRGSVVRGLIENPRGKRRGSKGLDG